MAHVGRQRHLVAPAPLRPDGGTSPRSRLRRWQQAACLVIALSGSLGLSGRGAAASPIEVTDDRGRVVTLPAPAHRAITLAPHATELVYAAGAAASLAGTVKGSNYPPAALALPSIGDGVRPSIETIAALKPDLVIAWLPGAAQGLEPFLQHHGIPIFYLAPRRLADLPDALQRLGQLFGTDAQAAPRASAMRAQLAALSARYAGRVPVRVLIQVNREPFFTLNGQSIVSDAVAQCGGVNIFADALPSAPQLSAEAVLTARPQAIVAGLADEADIAREREAWRATDPTHPPAFLAFDPDRLLRPGPRLLALTEELCEALDKVRHP